MIGTDANKKRSGGEYFRLSDFGAEDLLGERAGLSGLTFIGVIGGTAKAPVHRYSFPPQETEMRGDEDLRNLGGAKLGSVDEISIEERWIDIKKRGDSADIHPEAIFSQTVIKTDILASALFALENGLPIMAWRARGRFRPRAISSC